MCSQMGQGRLCPCSPRHALSPHPDPSLLRPVLCGCIVMPAYVQFAGSQQMVTSLSAAHTHLLLALGVLKVRALHPDKLNLVFECVPLRNRRNVF